MPARQRFAMLRTLSLLLLLPALAQAQGGQPAIARLGITPAVRTVAVGDSLRLQVQALDARGSVVPGVTIRFAAQGGRFQGNVDSAGVVRGGAPGTVPIAITAMAPNGRPHVEKIEVRIVAGPAARITVSPSVTRMLAGQRLQLDATVLAASGDARDDAVTWTSSNTNVLTFAGGLLTAVGPGTATITARAGQAVASLTTQVISSSGVTVSISPERASGRQGDVIRFTVDARDAKGQRITGLAPTWSFAPG
ncbi:MAG TPA: Ig-like domain-containing protein, partial [Gemmatimonadaceae bacterium]|nr:Ig-like domain-containing protein [Gemmatimonadaceae bacterium]